MNSTYILFIIFEQNVCLLSNAAVSNSFDFSAAIQINISFTLSSTFRLASDTIVPR